MLEHIDDISGAKRKENLRENADLARLSKELATLQRDIDAGVDVTEIADREPDRSRLREVFNRFELRDPLRRLEEALGRAGGGTARRRASGASRPTVREGAPADLPDEPVALAARLEDGTLRWAAAVDGEVLTGAAGSLREVQRDRSVAHDWKSIARAAGGEDVSDDGTWPGTRWSPPI